MRYFLILILLVFYTNCFSQAKNTLKSKSAHQSDTVSFVTRLAMGDLTKDGIYMNGYVVNMDHAQAKKLNGKKIRVSGKVTVVKAAPPGYQGRAEDSYHIMSPKIEVIRKQR